MYGAERTWVPAVVKSEKGNRIYELATVSGQSLTRHANQLWVYHGDTKASDNDKHHVTSNTKSLKPRRRQILCCLVFGREHDVKEPPWRLTRVKKPVQEASFSQFNDAAKQKFIQLSSQTTLAFYRSSGNVLEGKLSPRCVPGSSNESPHCFLGTSAMPLCSSLQ
ncbi:unnamed protein product [Enterobius vermicularis]|uniref:Uncharacterized protein n=1 Tax=Enterobius vermicularis TaxID=51028 RepID=A0A0N4UVG5_ENTVE|nr:unnamed protein product [Enterobius vermicularis]